MEINGAINRTQVIQVLVAQSSRAGAYRLVHTESSVCRATSAMATALTGCTELRASSTQLATTLREFGRLHRQPEIGTDAVADYRQWLATVVVPLAVVALDLVDGVVEALRPMRSSALHPIDQTEWEKIPGRARSLATRAVTDAVRERPALLGDPSAARDAVEQRDGIANLTAVIARAFGAPAPTLPRRQDRPKGPESCRTRDEVDVLIRPFLARMRAHASSLVRFHDEADDLVQETILSLFPVLSDPDREVTWSYAKIAMEHRAASLYRPRKDAHGRTMATRHGLPDTGISPEPIAVVWGEEQYETLEQLERTLNAEQTLGWLARTASGLIGPDPSDARAWAVDYFHTLIASPPTATTAKALARGASTWAEETSKSTGTPPPRGIGTAFLELVRNLQERQTANERRQAAA